LCPLGALEGVVIEEHETETPTPEVSLPVHQQTRFVLVRPHYPENVGAVARAIKTMGFLGLDLVKPGRLAAPDNEMALKMAVKSRDVLRGARCFDSIEQAVGDRTLVVTTTSRSGVSGVFMPREAAERVVSAAAAGERVAVLFGNEKSGLTAEEVERATFSVRIPMAAPQPSINLAQATQIIAYELLVAAFRGRVSSPA
jgi:TrmH family RNA methyltransferase